MNNYVWYHNSPVNLLHVMTISIVLTVNIPLWKL